MAGSKRKKGFDRLEASLGFPAAIGVVWLAFYVIISNAERIESALFG